MATAPGDAVRYRERLADEAATLAFGAKLARATFCDETCGPPAIPAASPAARSGNHDSFPAVTGIATTGGVIHLNGDLGVGKTTLVRGILRQYGFRGAVKSPTYTLVEPYEFDQCRIYHFDLYRLAAAGEVEFLGVDQYFQDSSLCLVEWAENGADSIPAPDLKIQLSGTGSGRNLQCQACSVKGEALVRRLGV